MASLLEFPERTVVVNEALTWPERATAARVIDGDSYQSACELLKGIKSLRLKIAETFDPHVKRAHDAHKALVKEKADAELPLTQAERIIKDALRQYDDEQERIRQAEQRRLEEAARQAEEARVLEQAALMEREGNDWGDQSMVAEAHAMIEQPIAAPPIAPIAKATPKVAGITYRETWRARVTNLQALVRYIADHPEHLALLTPNQAALNGLAWSLKAGLRLPGVQAVPTRDVAAGR